MDSLAGESLRAGFMKNEQTPINPRIERLVLDVLKAESMTLQYLHRWPRVSHKAAKVRRRLVAMLVEHPGYFSHPTLGTIAHAVAGPHGQHHTAAHYKRSIDASDRQYAEKFFNEWRARQGRAREVA